MTETDGYWFRKWDTLRAEAEEALESLALMAEGEGPDPEVYRDISKHAHDKLKKALKHHQEKLDSK